MNDDPSQTANHGGLSYAADIADGITLIVLVVTLVADYTSRTAMWNETIANLSTKLVEVTNAHTPP